MLRFLKRWLGWEDDSDYFDPREFEPRARPTSATARVLKTGPRKTATRPAPKPRAPSAPLDFEADAVEPQFDPYNTGKFDRSASWDRISKNNR